MKPKSNSTQDCPNPYKHTVNPFPNHCKTLTHSNTPSRSDPTRTWTGSPNREGPHSITM